VTARDRRRLVLALAAALLACGVRAPPRPPEQAGRRALVEPTPAGTTTGSMGPSTVTTTTPHQAP
jgi:hypothetical protein